MALGKNRIKILEFQAGLDKYITHESDLEEIDVLEMEFLSKDKLVCIYQDIIPADSSQEDPPSILVYDIEAKSILYGSNADAIALSISYFYLILTNLT